MYATHFYEWAFIIIKNSADTGEGGGTLPTEAPPLFSHPLGPLGPPSLAHLQIPTFLT